MFFSITIPDQKAISDFDPPLIPPQVRLVGVLQRSLRSLIAREHPSEITLLDLMRLLLALDLIGAVTGKLLQTTFIAFFGVVASTSTEAERQFRA